MLYLRISYVPVLSTLIAKHLFHAFEYSSICVERVFADTASGALSLRYDVVVSWYRVIKGHKGEAILVWVNFRLDLRVRDFKLLMLNFCCALGQTSSGVAYYPVLTATTSLTPHGVRGNKSADILRTPPIISEITALVCMTSRDLEYPCRSCILLNITYKCGSRAVFVLFNLKNSLEYGFPTGHQ